MKIIINENQLKRLLEDRDTANLLFTDKNSLVNYFNERIGVDLYVNVIKISSMNDLFIGETRNGASVFLNQKGHPFFNFKDMSHILRNSTMVAAYLNAIAYKKGTIRNYVPTIKHVVYVDDENCMAQVIDTKNHLLFVGLTTGEPLYNLTTKTAVDSDERNKYCVNISNFRPDERISKFAEQLKGKEVNNTPESNDTDNEESNKKHLMNDVFKSIMNGLNKGISIKQTIDEYGIHFQELRKYLPTSKIDAIFTKQEKLQNIGILKEERLGKKIIITENQLNLIIEDYHVSFNSRVWSEKLTDLIERSQNNKFRVSGKKYPDLYKQFPVDYFYIEKNQQINAYDDTKSGYNKNGEYCVYFLIIEDGNYSDILPHELRHAYEDFKRQSNNGNKISNTKEIQRILTDDALGVIMGKHGYLGIFGELFKGLYYTSKLEQSAYSENMYDSSEIYIRIKNLMKTDYVNRQKELGTPTYWKTIKKLNIPLLNSFNNYDQFIIWADKRIKQRCKNILKKFAKINYLKKQ